MLLMRLCHADHPCGSDRESNMYTQGHNEERRITIDTTTPSTIKGMSVYDKPSREMLVQSIGSNPVEEQW
jgi:hypothetical protein